MESNTFSMVRFTWNILYDCNYRCSYCFYDGKWEEHKKRDTYLSVQDWMGHWARVVEKYKKIFLIITGGEPFIYPNFIELIKELSKICHHINISTNGSTNLKEFVEEINPENVSVSLSFQKEYDSLDDFIERVKLGRRHNFDGCLNLVAYPPFLGELENDNKKLKAEVGEGFKIIPFFGKYNNIKYPEGYNQEERNLVGIDESWFNKIKRRGSLCYAGYSSAIIFSDGKVSRCGQMENKSILGNFFDPHFQLNDMPMLCDAEYCPCQEDNVTGEERYIDKISSIADRNLNNDKYVIRLNNAGRKFHKFINIGELSIGQNNPKKNEFFWALRNVYMTIKKGEIIGLIGRNGAGKSTLLSIIAGRLPVSEGDVDVKGMVSALLTLGAGFQDEFTGKENVYLNASLLGMKRQEIEEKFNDILEFSELGDFINAPLGSYSSGMKLRLGFSVAIHNDFDVLITDEIMTVGDIYFQKKCFEKMADFKRQGKSMIIATQDMSLVERFCDRVFLLEDGRIYHSGKPSEVIELYEMLLNKKKVLSESSRLYIVTETKRWATDMDEWGKREGTKEVIINDITVFYRWGKKTNKIKYGEKITVRVNYTANEEIGDFHFGVAIFREDGVYCYGPNTQFDGLALERMGKGDGYFELGLKELLLMPGIYYLSAAIWDKDEKFAYDYHKCTFKIEIAGDSAFGQLLILPNSWHNHNPLITYNKNHLPNLDFLVDKWESQTNCDLVNFESLTFLNNYGAKDSVFVTGRDFKIKLDYKIDESLKSYLGSLILWLGIYRSDGIYCHGSINEIKSYGENIEILTYPNLRLLPGGYRVSAGIWDSHDKRFLTFSHGIYSFNMISERRDHGTVYLDHQWNWRIPKGGISYVK